MTAPVAARPAIEGGPESWIAIVDDDDSLRRALSRALRTHGLRVRAFSSAEEFLGRQPVGEPDCLILDVHLPGISGFALRDRLASLSPSLPVVFITGHDDTPASLARVRGAAGFFRKPFETAALLAVLERHLRSAMLP